jgi:hypothetical protein
MKLSKCYLTFYRMSILAVVIPAKAGIHTPPPEPIHPWDPGPPPTDRGGDGLGDPQFNQ